MNAPVIIDPPLAKLRAPFPENQVSKLPKETRAQIDARKTDKSVMVWKCDVCGGAHHKNAVHLDYVGHAALTDRLLDTDIEWSWEPVAFNAEGLPAFDRNGGLWIRLTVCGVTRLGYGSADGKTGGDAIKEIIGDALRNAAMRFGAALDLWHKGDLHAEEEDAPEGGAGNGKTGGKETSLTGSATDQQAAITKIISLCEAIGGGQSQAICEAYKVSSFSELTSTQAASVVKRLTAKLAEKVKAEKTSSATDFAEILEDEIPF